MRMWMVPPVIMCDNHLRGEHRELHALAGLVRLGISLKGYVNNNLVQISSLVTRHTEIENEMLSRGFNCDQDKNLVFDKVFSKIETVPGTVDVVDSFRELTERCTSCRLLLQRHLSNSPQESVLSVVNTFIRSYTLIA